MIFIGSVLPLGKMELNPVAGLVLLSKATAISDDKPCLADLDSDIDEVDDQGTCTSLTPTLLKDCISAKIMEILLTDLYRLSLTTG